MPIATLKRRRRSIALLALAGWLMALAASIALGCQGCMGSGSHRLGSVASLPDAMAAWPTTFNIASVTHLDLPCPVADDLTPSPIVKETSPDDGSHLRLIPLLPASVQLVLPAVVGFPRAPAVPRSLDTALALLHSIRLLI